MMKKSILQEAHEIVNERSEEKTREYGDFSESMERAARIASAMGTTQFTAVDLFNVMIAMKLSRQSNKYKRDNLLDAAAYIQGLDNYHNQMGTAVEVKAETPIPVLAKDDKQLQDYLKGDDWAYEPEEA
jgi:hypothetical protein